MADAISEMPLLTESWMLFLMALFCCRNASLATLARLPGYRRCSRILPGSGFAVSLVPELDTREVVLSASSSFSCPISLWSSAPAETDPVSLVFSLSTSSSSGAALFFALAFLIVIPFVLADFRFLDSGILASDGTTASLLHVIA